MLYTLLISLTALQATAQSGEHAQHFNKCASVCSGCQLVCDSCFKHCLTLAGEGNKQHAETAQFWVHR